MVSALEGLRGDSNDIMAICYSAEVLTGWPVEVKFLVSNSSR